jgi:hypothetical protein
MALKKNPIATEFEESASSQKAKVLFNKDNASRKENKVLTTFSIEPSFKRELEELFSTMGLGWAAGIRFALKEFSKKYTEK